MTSDWLTLTSGAALLVVSATASSANSRILSNSADTNATFKVLPSEAFPHAGLGLRLIHHTAAATTTEAAVPAPRVLSSSDARKLLQVQPELGAPVGAALARLKVLFGDETFELTAERDNEDQPARLAIAVVTARSSDDALELLAEFDAWWLNEDAPSNFDVWIRHV